MLAILLAEYVKTGGGFGSETCEMFGCFLFLDRTNPRFWDRFWCPMLEFSVS